MKINSGKPDRPKKLGRPKKRGRPRKVIEVEKKARGKRVSDESRKKASVYANAVIVGGKSKVEGKALAGYGRNEMVERYPAVQDALRTVEQQREDLQGTVGFRLEDVAFRLKERATNNKVSPRDQTDNDKALVSVLGYAAEKKVSVSNTSLLMEFSGLTSEDLIRARERILSSDE